jgi:hypothetical protein
VETPTQILEEYNRFLFRKDEAIALRIKNELAIATLFGVDSEGLLLTSQGSFAWGDAEWVIH